MRIPETIKHLFLVSLVVLAIGYILKIDLSNVIALHFPMNENFGFWQYITHLFMHGDFGHLLFNFFTIWFFGAPLAESWGTKKFLFFFFSAGVGAALIYTAVNYFQFYGIYDTLIQADLSKGEIISILEAGQTNDPRFVNNITQEQFNKIGGIFNLNAFGASGAAYGVMTAYIVYYPNSRINLLFPPISLVAKYYVVTLVAADLFLGILNRVEDNVGRFAHVGGALVGYIIASYWKKNQFNYRR